MSTKIPHLAGAQRPTAAAAAEVLPLSFWVTIMTGDPSGRAAHGLARTRFLIGDPEMFAGVATSYPPILYSPADVAALDRGGAPFYPAQVTHIFSSLDGNRHHVGWSASWTGGTFIVTCGWKDGDCSVEVVSRWIT